jgi:hypothetical protein
MSIVHQNHTIQILENHIVSEETNLLAEVGREFPPAFLLEIAQKGQEAAWDQQNKDLFDHAAQLHDYAFMLETGGIESNILATDIVSSLLVVLRELYPGKSVSAETEKKGIEQ